MAKESPALILRCDCGQRMKVPMNAMGKTFKCVRCAAHLTVSQSNTEAAGATIVPAQATNPVGEEGKPIVPAPPERVGQMLIREEMITPEQLEQALAHQAAHGGKTFEILIALGFVTKDDLHAFLSRQTGVAAIDLKRFTIDRDLVRMIPKKLALEQHVLPIDRLGKLLTVAMACPLDAQTIAELERLTQLKVKAVLCKFDDLREAVAKYYRDPNELNETPETFSIKPTSGASRVRFNIADKLDDIESLPVAKAAADHLAALAADPKTPVGQLVEALAKDPALALTALRIANSSAYGMANTVDDLTVAAALIGRAGLAALAAQAVPANDNLDPLRLRAERAAQIAAALADRSGLAPIGPAFTASAIGTVGAIAMASVAPDKYRMLDSALALADLYKAEEGVFTQSHPSAGGALAVHWGLPGILKDAIETITPRPDTSVRAGLAALTRKLADNPAPADDVLAPFDRVIRALGLNAAAVKETAAQSVAG